MTGEQEKPDIGRVVDTVLHKRTEEEIAKAQEIKIASLISLPRVGFNDAWACAFRALKPLGIPLTSYTGAYWGHCLQNGLEDCIAKGIDWVLTLDYDTMFTAYDVDRLIGHLGQNAEIDAVAAYQCRRRGDTPLCSIAGSPGVQVKKNTPFKVTTAHFGLTLIRLDSLKNIPKPWFVGQPGPDGTWTHEDRIDPDIYFWKIWREAENTIYLAPDVRVGHLELMVSEFDENLKPRSIHVTEWREREKREAKSYEGKV